jgi:hypothetical protein
MAKYGTELLPIFTGDRPGQDSRQDRRLVSSQRCFKFRVAGPAQEERLSFSLLFYIRGVSLSTNLLYGA